jgi:hypothetical protein
MYLIFQYIFFEMSEGKHFIRDKQLFDAEDF